MTFFDRLLLFDGGDVVCALIGLCFLGSFLMAFIGTARQPDRQPRRMKRIMRGMPVYGGGHRPTPGQDFVDEKIEEAKSRKRDKPHRRRRFS